MQNANQHASPARLILRTYALHKSGLGAGVIRSISKLALAGGVFGATVFLGGGGPLPAASPDSFATPAVIRAREGRLPSVVPSVRVEGEIAGTTGIGVLTVRVGGVVRSQQAATGGFFAVDVPGGRDSGMVTLDYQQQGVHFNSNLGSYKQVARLAGPDARLTLDECACARVSAFSTALQLVVSRALGHAPTSDAQFDNMVRVVGGDLTYATIALTRFAEEPGQLPDSHPSGLALVEDRPAFAQFLYDTNYEILSGDPVETLDRVPAASMGDPDVAPRFATIGPLLDTRALTSVGASVIERVGGSTFKVHEFPGDGDLTFTGDFDGAGKFTLEPDREVVRYTAAIFTCPVTGELVAERHEFLRQSYRRHWTSGRIEIWQFTSESSTTMPDCPMQQQGEARASGYVVVADLSITRQLTNARRFQTVALPTFCDTSASFNGSNLIACEYAIHAFGRNGVGEVRELGMKVDVDMQPVAADGRAAFSWTMGADGAMHVQTGTERVRYWVLDGGDKAALGVLYVADADRAMGNVSVSGYVPMIGQHEEDIFAAVSPLGAWRLATVDAVNRGFFGDLPPRTFRVVRDAAGISSNWSDSDVTRRDTWMNSNGRLHTTSWRGSGCAPPIPGCSRAMVRTFRPLARVGNRIHGIEDIYYPGGTSGDYVYPVSRTDSRPQSQVATNMPDPPVGAGKALDAARPGT